MNEHEEVVLRHVLSAEFEGAQELRAQISLVEVVAVWGLGSVSVDFRMRGRTAARSAQREGHIPVDAEVVNEAGQYVGELLVWVHHGALAGLEYAWVTDEMPTALPAVESIRLRGRE
ncbi:hypothetical protein ACFRCW_33135 [Streptomyces sp. NPDC056653]|uniref:hypothetical protein n=1 Tax=unclassified Streptomyces TaxID=2593676 RepID=UPI0033A8B25C